MRRVCVVTGTRAEYGLLKPVMRAIQGHPGLALVTLVTGMHLSHEFGYTVAEIERDGFMVDARVDMLLSSDSSGAMAKSVGIGIYGIAQSMEVIRPEVVLVVGDRVEALAGAIAGAFLNKAVAHIHGGDRAKAGLDDFMRHAITKMAHIHFAATKQSAERIIKMGEREENVFVVGSPALDNIRSEEVLSPEETRGEFGLRRDRPLILVVQHAVSTEPDLAAEQMEATMEAIRELALPTIVIYPNSDAGGRSVIDVIREYEGKPFMKTFVTLDRKRYLGLLRVAAVLVGNSSSGIVESGSFGLPVVNIGTRQMNRERSDNVIDVGHDKDQIVCAIRKALFDQVFIAKAKDCVNVYGDGQTGGRIADILGSITIDKNLLQKQISY